LFLTIKENYIDKDFKMNKILLGSAVTVLLLAGCGEEKKSTSQETTTAEVTIKQEAPTKEVVNEALKDVAQTVSTAANEVSNTVVETTNKVIENSANTVNETTTEAVETAKNIVSAGTAEIKETLNNTVAITDEKVNDVKNVITDTKNEIKESVSNAETAISNEEVVHDGPNGELLFKACASCHGQKAEKEALGKSQIIAGWDKEKIINALHGYKDGTYGGIMKNIMKGQVDSKTDAEIDALATFISNL